MSYFKNHLLNKEAMTPVEQFMRKEMFKSFLRPIGIAQCVCLLGFISSIFIWIWHSWSLAWKVGLTSLVLVIILGLIYAGLKKIINNTIEENKDRLTEPKSKWQERMEEMQKRNPR